MVMLCRNCVAFVCLVMFLCCSNVVYGEECTDSVSSNWVKQLVASKFQLNDPSIDYPKFPRFCMKVYNWVDRVFNTYDSSYVVGTGKNWKAKLISYNWAGNNVLIFPNGEKIKVVSDIFSDFGPNVSFMALNLGYKWNVNRLWGHTDDDRRTFNFGFNCALLSANLNYSYVKGGTHITKFGDYNDGKRIDFPYNDIKQETFQIDAYYIFNNRRYSQAAGYAYSKYQLRSAGSWMLGAVVTWQSNWMDFTYLHESMKPFLLLDSPVLCVKYTDYNLSGGYGYNWVLSPKWLLNVTVMPSVGYRHSSSKEYSSGGINMFAANAKAMLSLTYNHRALFAGCVSRIDGFVFMGKNYTYFNSLQSSTVNVGVRF